MIKNVGIVGYGSYIPVKYVEARLISRHARALGAVSKSRPYWDEDPVTMGVEAAHATMTQFNLKSSSIGAVYVGSESSPYAVKPISTIIADCLGVGEQYQSVDLQFACKAATAGLQLGSQYVMANPDKQALIVGTDASQAKVGDTLECTTGAGAAAFALGKENVVAEIVETLSFSSDTPDFWRRNNQATPHHAGRFSGEPAYYKHIIKATKLLLNRTNLSAKDVDHAVFHMPNGKFPNTVAKRLGFSYEQIKTGLVGPIIGNAYTASSLLGLVAVLENAKPGEIILVTSYGSGAGSDSFIIETTPLVQAKKQSSLGQLLSTRKVMEVEDYRESLLWH